MMPAVPFCPALTAQLESPAGPGLLELFARSGWMAKLVLSSLVILSLVSWTIIISKAIQLRRARRHSRRFLDLFRRSKRFSEVNEEADALSGSPLVGLFQAGYVEIDAQIKDHQDSSGGYRLRSLEALGRSLRRAVGAELQTLSAGMGFLATTAAASPFIGLFGTVWGIMIAFQEIGITGSTSLVAVAPGIAEALINTAAGLLAAIPALMAYNYFSARLREQKAEMEDFLLEFVNLAERNFT